MKASSQHGVALISVLLVVAVATVMSVSMIQTQRSSILSAQGYLGRTQAMQYALGGEELGRQILYEDFEALPGRDTLMDHWASPELQFQFEDGEVHLQITDMQSLVNLNGLNGRRASVVRQRFSNLLNAYTLDTGMLDRVQDWIDEDEGTRPAGAEDFEYLVMDPPYRTANSPLVHPSELLLTGLDPESYALLLPMVVALPDENSGMNVNTMSPGVLQSLAPELTYEAAESLTQRRDENEGYETVEAFLQEPELAGLPVVAEGLSVQSAFFEIQVTARYQDRFAYLRSLVQRDTADGTMRVIQRDFSRSLRPMSQTESADFE